MMRSVLFTLYLALGASLTASGGIQLPASRFAVDAERPALAQTDLGLEFKDAKKKEKRSDGKSPGRAFLLSFVIPGAGDYYVGNRTKAKVFFVTEVVGWSAFVAFRHLGSWRENDYRLYAARSAGVDLGGKDDRFFDIIGFYRDRDDYNQIGRVGDPRQPYYPDSPEYFWRWPNEQARQTYRNLKNDSKSYYRNGNFALGAIAANHLLSALSAYISAKRFNSRLESGFGLELRPESSGGWQLVLSARF